MSATTRAHKMWGRIELNDHRLMRRVHRWKAPRWVRIATISVTRMGDGWLWYALGLILLVYGGHNRFIAVGAAASAAGIGIYLFRTIKTKSRRKRPCEIEPHCWAHILPPDKYSFPSGHTITAFAIALPVGICYPELQVWLFVAALLIASSRIILGMHFLSDVIAGALIGSALGITTYQAFIAMHING
jgi:undecaprenyl-diphosphatase